MGDHSFDPNIQHIHGYEDTPNLEWVPTGYYEGCGAVDGSQYCEINHTIYIPENDIDLAYWYGDGALAYIVAHEYAHAMQTSRYGTFSEDRLTELEADCLAGLYLAYIPNVAFDDDDVEEMTALAYDAGDNQWFQDHHGTPEERLAAVVRGMRAASDGLGIEGCLYL